MNTARPFSGPISVSLAGLTLLALATASFISGLTHQLNQPRPDNTAQVVVVQPNEAPPPAPAQTLAALAPATAQPVKARPPAPPRRRAPAAPDVAPVPEATDPLSAPVSAADVAEDAAATGPSPLDPRLTAPPEPAPPP